MSIIFCGDTHGTIDIKKVEEYCKNHSKKEIGNTLLLHTGDMGIIWYPKKNDEEVRVLNLWESFGFKHVFFVPGNHENYERLFSDEFPTDYVSYIDKPVKRISKSISMLPNDFYVIEKKKFYTFRGAQSIDKQFRVPYVSWWPEEVPQSDEYGRAKEITYNTDVDYMLCHTGPQIFKRQLFRNTGEKSFSDPVEQMIERLMGGMRCRIIICGHYHMDAVCSSLRCMTIFNTILTTEQIEKEIASGGIMLKGV